MEKNIRNIIKEQLEKTILKEEKGLNSKLENIAKKYLSVKTLKTQNSDSADFHDLAVWQIKSALKAAYKLGQSSQEPVEESKKPIKENKTSNSKVEEAYNKIVDLIKKKAKQLNDDDTFELHEKLKAFFNKLI